MRFVQALALAGSSVAFAEHKAFQEKYIIGCSTEQIATANSITDSFRTCAEELYGAGTIQEVDDAIDAEDYQGAARKFIAVVNDAMETKGQKELSKGLCACVDSFNSGLPACGDINDLKGNLTLVQPFCDLGARCPEVDVKPALAMAKACFNESADEICAMDSEHPCNDATKPLYEEEYQASLLQCAASLDFPFSKALPPGFSSDLLDFSLVMSELAKRTHNVSKALDFDQAHELACKVHNFTSQIKTPEKPKEGDECDDEKASRVVAQRVIYELTRCGSSMSTISSEAPVRLL